MNEKQIQILRTIDKKDRLGLDECKRLLRASPDDDSAGCGCSEYEAEVWSQFLDLPSGSEHPDGNIGAILEMKRFMDKLLLINEVVRTPE